MICEFEKRDGDVAFPKIKRQDVADQLRRRIEKSSTIRQGNSSLCGPAVYIYSLAKRKPKQYVRYVIELYEQGEGGIGRLQVKPRMHCKNFDPATDQTIAAVDWIALAGLRDSENTPSDPNGPTGGTATQTIK